MKSILKPQFILAFVLGALFLASCSNENEGVFTPEEETKYKLVVVPTENPDSLKLRNLEVVSGPGTLVTVDVNFKKGPNPMRRLYMTKNGEPFEYPIGSKKRDGSINLDGADKDEFNFQMKFDAPSNNGEVVRYVLWATKEQGDFRDISNDNAINKDPNNPAYGTITIKADENATETGILKSFSTVLLTAPSNKGITPSFGSLYDGNSYKIAQQTKDITDTYTEEQKAINSETARKWDFGYYWTGSKTEGKANFSSASTFMTSFVGKNGEPIVDITRITGLTAAELNSSYFEKSSVITTEAQFDAISSVEDLANLSVTTSSSETISGFKEGDVIEFLDAYGNKGLIRVKSLEEGYQIDDTEVDSGQFVITGHVKLDIKVILNALPIKQ